MFLNDYDVVDVRDSSSSDVEAVGGAEPARLEGRAAATAVVVDGATTAVVPDPIAQADASGGRHRFAKRQERSKLEHMCIAARMREKKAMKASARSKGLVQSLAGKLGLRKRLGHRRLSNQKVHAVLGEIATAALSKQRVDTGTEQAAQDFAMASDQALRLTDVARSCAKSKHRVRTGQKLTGLSLIKAMEKRLEFWLEECRKSPTLLAVHFHVGADSAKSTCTSTIVLDDLDEMLQVAAPHNVLQKSRFMVIVFADATVEVT